MAVDLKVSKKIDDNNVQVDAKRTRTGTHYYKVPTQNVDEFCASYKKFNKKKNLTSDLSFFGSVFLGCAVSSVLTSTLKDAPRTIIMVVSGLGLGYLSDLIVKKSFDKKQHKMFSDLNAQEILLKDTPKVADLIK